MAKISKTIKNQNPEVYGYESPLDIPGYEEGKTFYMSFKDYDGDIRYCQVTKELYEWDRNQRRKEEQRRDRRSRCMIPSKKYGLKICNHNCDECPFNQYKRTPSIVEMDFLYDNYEIEFADESQESIEEVIIKEERMRALNIAISNLNEGDRLIIELFKLGKSDSEIAEETGSFKSTVQYRRTRIFDEIREQLKDF